MSAAIRTSHERVSDHVAAINHETWMSFPGHRTRRIRMRLPCHWPALPGFTSKRVWLYCASSILQTMSICVFVLKHSSHHSSTSDASLGSACGYPAGGFWYGGIMLGRLRNLYHSNTSNFPCSVSSPTRTRAAPSPVTLAACPAAPHDLPASPLASDLRFRPAPFSAPPIFSPRPSSRQLDSTHNQNAIGPTDPPSSSTGPESVGVTSETAA